MQTSLVLQLAAAPQGNAVLQSESWLLCAGLNTEACARHLQQGAESCCSYDALQCYEMIFHITCTSIKVQAILLRAVLLLTGQRRACAKDENFDSYTPCVYSGAYRAHRIVAYVALGLYMCFHVWYLRVGRKHHSIVPYSSFR